MSDKSDKNEEGVVEEAVDAAEEAVAAAEETVADAAEAVSGAASEAQSNMGSFLPLIAVLGLLVVVGGALYYVLSNTGGSEPATEQTADSTPTPGSPAATKEIPSDLPEIDVDVQELTKAGSLGDNIMGSADAPVTIIEYSSMTCPHCADFHEKTLPDLKKKYIDTGKVRYILREFPLDNLAAAAFMLGRCVDSDKYFTFIDAMYASQKSWAYGSGDPTPRLFDATKLAGAGFTKDSFEKCLQSQKLLEGISEVRERGSDKFTVRSTPTFFVNGRRMSGAQNIERFEKFMKPYL